MSELPSIPEESIYKRLADNLSSKQAETTYQLAHLELLAESLRTQRDAAREEAKTLKSENDELHKRFDALTSEHKERDAGVQTIHSLGDPDNTKP